jgi:hypothetical protein
MKDLLAKFSDSSLLRRIPQWRIDRFASAFVFVSSVHVATGRGDDPIGDCVAQFERMDCFDRTWFRLVLISVPPGRRRTIDVAPLKRKFEDCENYGQWESELNDCALGFDPSLAPDEVRVLMVQFMSEHWPSRAEYDLRFALESFLPSRIEAARRALSEFVGNLDNFTCPEGQAAFRYDAEEPLKPACKVPVGRSWRTIRAVCVKLLAGGWNPDGFAREICEEGEDMAWDEEDEIGAIRENQVRLLKWALAHGADPNHVLNGQSCLDVVEEGIEMLLATKTARPKTERLALLTSFRETLLKAGARTRKAIRAEPSPIWWAVG